MRGHEGREVESNTTESLDDPDQAFVVDTSVHSEPVEGSEEKHHLVRAVGALDVLGSRVLIRNGGLNERPESKQL